jgi:hypothetical protein
VESKVSPNNPSLLAKLNARFRKLVKITGSLKFAVFTILGLSILIAAGTFVEAEYNAEVAAKLIYKTPWMFAALGLLAVNLTSVMVDRWPWQRKHVSFILAHIGILVLLWGSVVTMKYGLDGTLAIEIGGSGRFVRVPETEFTVWSSFDGDRYSKVFEKEVDFFTDRPDKNKPLKVPALGGDIEVLEYVPFAIPNRVVEASKDEMAGSALRFQIQNAQVNVNEWMIQKKAGEIARHNFGPAQFYLGPAPSVRQEKNELYVESTPKGLLYTIFYKDAKRPPLKGLIREGESVNTGWMNLEFRVLRYLPQATERWDFKVMERPTPLSTAAVKVRFMQQERWVALNDVIKFFAEQVVYIVSYSNRRIDIGFDLNLADFQMGLYPGTNRAASYQSVVRVPDLPGDHLISMNEPLKHKGLTFYQASFQNGPDGKPTTSVFSVNYDPGRALKYLGSLILSLGIVWLFYDRRKAASAAARKMNAKN